MDKYLHYTPEDFALDESFISWVKNDNKTAVDFWEDWIKSNPSKTEIVLKSKRLVENLRFKSNNAPLEKEKSIWTEIQKNISIEAKEDQTIPNSFGWLKWTGVAATLLAIIYFTFGGDSTKMLSTSLAEIKTIQLPEGSRVQINASSILSYDENEFLENRQLKLDGEAFFEVKKGSSFVVITAKGRVEVLGTSFNVFARDEILKVFCETGKVAVISDFDKTILNPNEKVLIKGKMHQTQIVSENKRIDWIDGIFHYDQSMLQEIVLELERQLDLEIKLEEGLGELLYTGSFDASNKEMALSEICWPLGLAFEIKSKKVRIYKK